MGMAAEKLSAIHDQRRNSGGIGEGTRPALASARK
jgi:hypothetical protein